MTSSVLGRKQGVVAWVRIIGMKVVDAWEFLKKTQHLKAVTHRCLLTPLITPPIILPEGKVGDTQAICLPQLVL